MLGRLEKKTCLQRRREGCCPCWELEGRRGSILLLPNTSHPSARQILYLRQAWGGAGISSIFLHASLSPSSCYAHDHPRQAGPSQGACLPPCETEKTGL